MAHNGAAPMVATAGRLSPRDSLVARTHPDDHAGLLDWDIYGPRDPEIARLVHQLACDKGLRLPEIEALIRDALRQRLAE